MPLPKRGQYGYPYARPLGPAPGQVNPAMDVATPDAGSMFEPPPPEAGHDPQPQGTAQASARDAFLTDLIKPKEIVVTATQNPANTILAVGAFLLAWFAYRRSERLRGVTNTAVEAPSRAVVGVAETASETTETAAKGAVNVGKAVVEVPKKAVEAVADTVETATDEITETIDEVTGQ